MNATVIRDFVGREEGFTLFKAGAAFSGTAERVGRLAALGFVEPEKATPKRKPRATKKTE